MQYDLYHFPRIDSTNTWALSNTHLFNRDRITLVIADKQSSGRGRFKHAWVSSENNLYASFSVFLPKANGIQTNLPLVMALASIKTLEEEGFSPRIKWPNDLLLHGKKVGGILTETVEIEDTILYVIGVGINVNMPLDLLSKIDMPATSLSVESKREHPAGLLLCTLQKHFAEALELFLEKGFAPFLSNFQDKLALEPNQPVSFHEGGILLKGKFHSLNEDGSLNLKLETGKIKRCFSGEIETKSNIF